VARALLAAKLLVPRARPTFVARPRLLARLEAGAAVPLTLVSAPPGFGKTTLLAEWARVAVAAGRGVAWLSLDAGDNEPDSFWSYLSAALEPLVPSLRKARDELAVAGLVPTPQAITSLLHELPDDTPGAWLVLDDYHLVSTSEVQDGVRFLLENLPPALHLLIGTRADPSLPLPRWRVRGDLVEVRAADLRFTGPEAAEYLRTATGLALAAPDLELLAGRTEGWIAALQLAGLSLRGRPDPAGFIERFAGDDRFIVDYLMDEVLAHQGEDVREFLALTSVLERLTGDLCDAVTGTAGGAAMLAQLERANLFVVPLDDQGVWFRYHHLFADVLRARLLAGRSGEQPVVHARASRWFEANGFIDEAIRHAFAGRDHTSAARLVEAALPAARRDRRDEAMLGWLRALPGEVVARNPVLLVFLGWTCLVAGDLVGLETRLDQTERLLDSVPPGSEQPWPATDELRALPATIGMYRASLAQARGDLAGVVSHAHRVVEVAGPDDHFWRGAAAGFLALAAWSEGDVRTAVTTFTAALASLHAAGALVDELNSTALLAEMWTVAGRPRKARELCRKALAAADALGLGAARASADLHVALAELEVAEFERGAGDLGAAEDQLAAAEPLAARGPTSESHHRRFVTAALVAAARSDHERALALLDTAESSYRPGFYPDVRPIAAVRARVWISAGDLESATDWATGSGVSTTDEPSYLREYEHLTLARLLLARAGPTGAVDDAAHLLRRLETAAAASGREGSLGEIRRLLARATNRVPDKAAALPTEGLTERELQVLRLLDGELSGPEIARRLFVSPNTLRTHTRHIFTKLEVTTRRAAVARARERGLL
jgi:LuxR family maltose regulon positive regulatory protein